MKKKDEPTPRTLAREWLWTLIRIYIDPDRSDKPTEDEIIKALRKLQEEEKNERTSHCL